MDQEQIVNMVKTQTRDYRKNKVISFTYQDVEYTFYMKEITGSYFGTDKDKVGLYVIPVNPVSMGYKISELYEVDTLEGVSKKKLKEINSALGTTFTMEDLK